MSTHERDEYIARLLLRTGHQSCRVYLLMHELHARSAEVLVGSTAGLEDHHPGQRDVVFDPV